MSSFLNDLKEPMMFAKVFIVGSVFLFGFNLGFMKGTSETREQVRFTLESNNQKLQNCLEVLRR